MPCVNFKGLWVGVGPTLARSSAASMAGIFVEAASAGSRLRVYERLFSSRQELRKPINRIQSRSDGTGLGQPGRSGAAARALGLHWHLLF